MKTFMWSFLTGIAIVGGGAAVAWWTGFFDSANAKACERDLLTRLKAPSGYHRVSLQEGSRKISEDEVWSRLLADPGTQMINGRDPARDTLQDIRSSPTGYREEYVYIEYDAPNGFGVPIRGHTTCDKIVYALKSGAEWETRMRYDGETVLTRLDRLTKMLKEQSDNP